MRRACAFTVLALALAACSSPAAAPTPGPSTTGPTAAPATPRAFACDGGGLRSGSPPLLVPGAGGGAATPEAAVAAVLSGSPTDRGPARVSYRGPDGLPTDRSEATRATVEHDALDGSGLNTVALVVRLGGGWVHQGYTTCDRPS